MRESTWLVDTGSNAADVSKSNLLMSEHINWEVWMSYRAALDVLHIGYMLCHTCAGKHYREAKRTK